MPKCSEYRYHINPYNAPALIKAPAFFRNNSILIWMEGHCSQVKSKRHCSRVVRATWLWCRKPHEGPEFEVGLGHPTTRKLSLSTEQKMGTVFKQGTD